MLGLEDILAGSILMSVTFYAILGGADYGAGIWYLWARGQEGHSQRQLISTAIGPIWEANHVWLILALTLLFSAFPPAFARMTTLLHIPMTLLMLGIVIRGSAFAFRSYDVRPSSLHRFWGILFGGSSVMTSMFLGIILGTLASANLVEPQGGFFEGFVRPWIQPFPLAVGVWTMTLFALLASIYLIYETSDPVLRRKFRTRALWTMVLSGLMAGVVYLLPHEDAPDIRQGLTHQLEGWMCVIVATASMTVTATGLWNNQFHLARYSAVVYVASIIWGWGFIQYPYLVKPDLTIHNSASPSSTLVLLLIALTMGMILVFPSLLYLFRVFRKIRV
jgi:cytochrome bd ubiquinol oxidase subunit II